MNHGESLKFNKKNVLIKLNILYYDQKLGGVM